MQTVKINPNLSKELERRAWEFLEAFEDDSGRYVLIVRTKGEDDNKLHDFRTYWGYMAFAHSKEDSDIVRFTTL